MNVTSTYAATYLLPKDELDLVCVFALHYWIDVIVDSVEHLLGELDISIQLGYLDLCSIVYSPDRHSPRLTWLLASALEPISCLSRTKFNGV